MGPRPPDPGELRRIAERFGLSSTDSELDAFRALIADTLGSSYARLDQLAEPTLEVKYPRTPGYRPSPEENPLGAWYWRCDIEGAPEGVLSGKRVAIKDNVSVAAVPMMNGSRLLEGFVPAVDATVVTRILDAGGHIVGKAVCEHLCFSGGSHTSDTGPVRNPHDPARNAGGSSSGSAALVVAGEVDLAIGGDQGGSIRVPSSYCGCYGLKPTHGLVPYTGAAPIEQTLDHLGPMASHPRDLALLLGAIAGPDAIDPRQVDIQLGDYSAELDRGVQGVRIGLVEEGFDWPQSEPAVDDAVRAAAEALRGLGAEVEFVSIPWHRDGLHIWTGIALEGAFSTVIRGNSGGTNARGFFDTALIDHFNHAKAHDANDLSVTVKFTALLGEYLQTRYGGRYYAKARNLARSLLAAYETALSRFDVLAMPTTPRQATLLPEPGASVQEVVDRAWESEVNTRPFDVTGHPALSLPCAMNEELPVGLMLVGGRLREALLLRVASACASEFAPPVGLGG
jgi:amidase